MESSDKGIDVGGRVLDMLLAFAGDTEEQNRVFFRVKGKKVFAAATAKNRAIEVEGKAGEGSEEGEWPVDGPFLRNLAACTVNGSAKVPAIIGRLLCQRTGVSMADLVFKESGVKKDTLQHHGEMPSNTQLSFKQIHKTIDPTFDAPGSWFPIDKKLHAALAPVLAAVGKGRPVSVVGGVDEQAPVGFQAKGEDFVVRGILIPPAVQGPGREAVDQDDDQDDDGEEQPRGRSGRSMPLPFPSNGEGSAPPESGDGSVISDEEAEALKAQQEKGDDGLTDEERENFVERGDKDAQPKGRKRKPKAS